MLSLEFFYRFLLSPRAGSLVKTISRICIVGVWLGVTSLIIVISVMNGFNKSIHERLLGVEPHLHIRFKDTKSVAELKQHPVQAKVRALPTSLVAPMSQQDVILRTEEGFIQHAIAQGVTKERLFHLLDYAYRRSGRSDDGLKEKIAGLKPGEVILGMGLADATGLFYDNQVVVVPPELFLMPASERTQLNQVTIKGFITTDTPRVDDHGLFYLVDQGLGRLRGTASEQLGLEIWLQEPGTAALVKSQLLDPSLEIETWQERNASLFFALKVEKFVIGFLVSLSTVIAGLSIISVILLLLAQKRKDVGNLLAMGMTQAKITHLFVFIGLFLALTGVVAGIVVGVGGSLLIDRFSADVLPAFYEDTNIPAQVKFSQILAIAVVSTLLSYTVLRLTMEKVTKVSPSDLLRG